MLERSRYSSHLEDQFKYDIVEIDNPSNGCKTEFLNELFFG
jgi:hypothetical protein